MFETSKVGESDKVFMEFPITAKSVFICALIGTNNGFYYCNISTLESNKL